MAPLSIRLSGPAWASSSSSTLRRSSTSWPHARSKYGPHWSWSWFSTASKKIDFTFSRLTFMALRTCPLHTTVRSLGSVCLTERAFFERVSCFLCLASECSSICKNSDCKNSDESSKTNAFEIALNFCKFSHRDGKCATSKVLFWGRDLGLQPGACKSPVSIGTCPGHLERLGGLLHGKAGEIPELEYPGGRRVVLVQLA